MLKNSCKTVFSRLFATKDVTLNPENEILMSDIDHNGYIELVLITTEKGE